MTTTMTIIPISPTSPASPKKKRRSLRIPSIQAYSDVGSPKASASGPGHSRKSSQTSLQQYSPTIPRPPSSKRPSSSRLSIGSNISGSVIDHAGLGNLADELDEVWDGEFEDSETPFLEGHILHSPTDVNVPYHLDTSIPLESPQRNQFLVPPKKPTSPSKQWASMGTHHKTESLYDGSDYGPSSDDEAFDSIPPTLQRRIHDLEEIARITANADSLSEAGGVITRTTAALKGNLGAQSTVEAGVTRLITAYTSMATHRTHQTRDIIYASHAVTTGFSGIFDLPTETIDLLITQIDDLAATLPFLPTQTVSPTNPTPLIALQAYGNDTHELLMTLHGLTDTLTEHRQHLLTATRRLKSVRELVEELAIEEELVETSMMLIQAGDWDRRCRERHATKSVQQLLEGFKNTWDVDYAEDGWRPASSTRRGITVHS